MPGGNASFPEGAPLKTEIAVDADYEYFLANGSSVDRTVADIERLLTHMSAIYERDVGICFKLATVIIRSDPDDPYESTDMRVFIDEFVDQWNTHHRDLRADVMHLFTGKVLDHDWIGMARCIGCVCRRNRAYALSAARYTRNFARRVALVAHEIGHVYGAYHCCSGCGRNCDDCAIMCPCIGDCSGGIDSFASGAVRSIVRHRDSRTCLSACGEDDSVPCDAVRDVRGRCRASGVLAVTVRLKDAGQDGRTVRVMVDDQTFDIRVVRRKARAHVGSYKTGEHTIRLIDPVDCVPPVRVSCP